MCGDIFQSSERLPLDVSDMLNKVCRIYQQKMTRLFFIFATLVSFIVVWFTFYYIPSLSISQEKYNFTLWRRPKQFLDNIRNYELPVYRRNVTPKKHPAQIIHMTNGDDGRMRSVVNDTGLGKIILLKNNPNWNWFPMAKEGLEKCPLKCTIINYANHFITEEATAIIFYATNYKNDLPVKKSGQVWIFFTLESPYYSLDNQFRMAEWRNKINWTMTYRQDSDIWYPYGRVTQKKSPENIDYLPVIKNKTKQVAWFVSHCKTPSHRESYVKEMRKYISVDTYGACGKRRCLSEGSVRCFQMLSRDYKFYLSFENAFCDDYVTEKVFEFMQKADIIPVVRGGAKYLKYLPPMSYISTSNFESARQLSEYLLYLDSDDVAYGAYLEWKNYYYVEEKPIPICEVCIKLWNPKPYVKVYKNVYAWWHRNSCSNPKDIDST